MINILADKKKLVTFIPILIPVFIYTYIFTKYSFNFPVDDDYEAILQMLNNFIEANSFSSKLAILFNQHNVHFVVIYRLIFIVQYYITGTINFITPVLLGNIL
jgi:hypothetical protein